MTLKNIEVMPFNAYNSPTRISSTDANTQIVLADGTAQAITLSTAARYFRLTGNKDFFAAFGTTSGGSTQVAAAIPSTTTVSTVGNFTEHFPGNKAEHWKSGSDLTYMSIIASSAMTIGLQQWKD